MSTQAARPIILLAFANDRDDRVRYLRNLPEEARQLEKILDRAQRDGLCELVVRQNTTVDTLFDLFQDRVYRDRIALFHFGGHANSYQLLFETTPGQPARADAAGLAAFLGRQTGLHVVFLNGCSTERQVRGLLDAGISAVIATSQAIDDAVATEFAGRFYRGLAGGATIRTAYGEAEAAVQTTRGRTTRGGTTRTGLTRHVMPAEAQEILFEDRFPWGLHTRVGADPVLDWNLPDAAGDPLFGMPPLPELDLPSSPYRHLNWYRREEAEVFFGRGREIRDLYERVTAPHGAPLVLFYGQSGVGKSSLLLAGLLPRLERAYAIRNARRDAGLGLLGTLQRELETEGESVRVAWSRLEEQEGKPLLVVLDQVEECFTRANGQDPQQGDSREAEPEEFGELLAALQETFADPTRRPRGKLILSFRKEWLAEIEARTEAKLLPHARFFLERLDRRGIVEVVTGPTRTPRLRDKYALEVSPDLPGAIADDLLWDQGSPVAPTLQILLCRMWEVAREGDFEKPDFDLKLYGKLRAQGLGLADFFDQQLDDLRGEQREAVDSGLVLDLLAHHTTPLGTAEERTLTGLKETYRHQADALPRLVQGCQDRYLLVDPARNEPDKPPASRLAHDTLGPVVRQRFDESDRPGQRARRILENRAMEWVGEASGTPLDGADLAVVEENARGMRAWTGAEKKLVEASRQKRAQRRRNERIWRGLGLLALIALVIAGAVAVRQWQVAKTQKAVALAADAAAKAEASRTLARQLASQALYSLESEQPIERSLLLAVESLRATQDGELPPLLEADDALRRVLEVAPLAVLRHDRSVAHVLFSHDATRLAAMNDNGTLVLWDTGRGEELTVVFGVDDPDGFAFSADGSRMIAHDGSYRLWDTGSGEELARLCNNCRVEFSPNGARLAAVIAYASTVPLWDAESGEKLAELSHEGQVDEFVFSPDSAVLATSGLHLDAVHLWDATSGDERVVLPHQWGLGGVDSGTDEPPPVSFSPDGTRLVTVDLHDAVHLWDADSGEELAVLRHTDSVWRLAFSLDGTRLATGSWDGSAYVVDAVKGEKLDVLQHEDRIWDVVLSPDGTRLATVAGDGIARIWDVGSGKEPAVLPNEGSVNRVVFSPVFTRLVTFEDDGAFLWDTDTGTEVGALRDVNGLDEVAFSPDGMRLVTGGDYGRAAILWDAATGNELTELLREDEDRLQKFAFSLDGALLATASQDATAHVWDATSGEQLAVLPHDGGVYDVVFSPDGALLATGSEDGTVRMWRASGSQEPAWLGPVRWGYEAVTFSPKGTRLATIGQDGSARLWDVESGQLVAKLFHEGNVYHSVFSSDGSLMGIFTQDGAARAFDAESGKQPAVLRDRGLDDVIFSLDGGRLVASNKDDGTVRQWETSGGKELAVLRHDFRVLGVVSSPDGTRLVTCTGDDGTWRLWDADRGEELAILGQEDCVGQILFSSDGTRLATYTEGDGTVRLWNAEKGQKLAELAHEGTLAAVVFSTNGRLLGTVTEDGAARVWDAETGDVPAVLRDEPFVGNVVFSPDGARLVAFSSDDRIVRQWEVGNSKELPELPHDTGVARVVLSPHGTRLATFTEDDDTWRLWDANRDEELAVLGSGLWGFPLFSPDDSRLVTRSEDGIARLWDAGTGEELAVLPHDSGVSGLGFSPDGLRLVSLSRSDLAAHLWDPDTGEELAVLRHDSGVWGITFGPDGSRLVTVYEDGIAHLWRVRIEDLALLACDIVTRNLTQDEWLRYLRDRPYRPTCPDLPAHTSVIHTAIDEGIGLAQKGDIEGARARFDQARGLDPRLEIDAQTWNDLCRYGSLWGHAVDVMDACEQAVALAPDRGDFRDSRGIARALTGDLEGSIEDFEFHVEWLNQTGEYESGGNEREAWISELQAGRNPFDAATLAALREP